MIADSLHYPLNEPVMNDAKDALTDCDEDKELFTKIAAAPDFYCQSTWVYYPDTISYNSCNKCSNEVVNHKILFSDQIISLPRIIKCLMTEIAG